MYKQIYLVYTEDLKVAQRGDAWLPVKKDYSEPAVENHPDPGRIDFFIKQKKKLLKFKLADNVEEYGISLDQFTPATVQRLLLIDYISKIEISKPEFVSSRQETMDLTKLIVYSVLYRQYDTYIFTQILNSDVIKKWNRLNPANIIDEKTHINENFLRSVLKKNEKIIFEAKQEILSPLYTFINKNTSLLPEEKNIQLLLSEKIHE